MISCGTLKTRGWKTREIRGVEKAVLENAGTKFHRAGKSMTAVYMKREMDE